MESIKNISESSGSPEFNSKNRKRLEELLTIAQPEDGRKKIEDVINPASDAKVNPVPKLTLETRADPENNTYLLTEILLDVFGGNTEEIVLRLAKSHLSVKNMLERIERLKQDLPDDWM